mmetsp:Transcript_46469/g.131378  ORF Transcript_46469/g.131378 Transcript_46469/m.131378 type:complete len:247 (+) Transcript_46469:57-797(+)
MHAHRGDPAAAAGRASPRGDFVKTLDSAVAAVDSHLEGSPIAYRPWHEGEGMRLRRKAAIESAQAEWFRRSQEHQSASERRLRLKAANDAKSIRHLWEKSLQHEAQASRIDHSVMKQAIAFESDHAEAARRFREDSNSLIWAARTEYESARARARREEAGRERGRNHILVQSTQKRRELQSARAAAVEEIVGQCRQQRHALTTTPHSARTPFAKPWASSSPAGFNASIVRKPQPQGTPRATRELSH